MQVTKAEALCQEFCDTVSVAIIASEDGLGGSRENLEIKTHLDRKFFTELLSRMAGAGYCCTQVQRDIGANKCVAWFEEARNES